MPNRTAKFASAIFAGLLAGAGFATISYDTADAADDCLTGPKGETPEGSHWYYRIDRVTKRHCWYLRDEGEKLTQAAPPAAASPAKPVAAKTEPTMQRSVADARAEFSAQPRFEQPRRGDEPAMAASADTAAKENYGAAPLPGAATSESVVASRWPDSSVLMAPAGPAPVKPDVVAAVSPPAPALKPAAIAAGAVADASSQATAYSVQGLLAALIAALAFAGFLGSTIFKFAGRKRPVRPNLRARRAAGTIWQPTDDDRIVLAAHPETETRARGPIFARDLDRRDNADERVAEFFSQLSRRAPT
jgi:hypothetical protein